jgi:hypothetical protein
VAALASASASAQTYCALAWQVSLDGGMTWQSGMVEAPRTQPSVEVRLLAEFGGITTGGETPLYMAWADLDGVVFAASGGLGDTASNVRLLRAGGVLATAPFGSQRQGALLKFDSPFDTLAPGVGNGWLEPLQSQDAIGNPPGQANPIPIVGYTLFLDGTLGRRDIYGVFRTRRPTETYAGREDIFLGLPGIASYTPPDELSIVNTSIVVVPTPAGVVVGGGGDPGRDGVRSPAAALGRSNPPPAPSPAKRVNCKEEKVGSRAGGGLGAARKIR